MSNAKYHVAAIDCGMKQNIIRCLNRLGCNVTVFPWNTSLEEIERSKPDGIFLSNGPGNPTGRTFGDRVGETVTWKISDFRDLSGTSDYCTGIWSKDL